MRKPKALVIPLRFREGYPDEIVDCHVGLAAQLLDTMDLDYDMTENVIHPEDADLVVGKYNATRYDFVILLIATWIEPILAVRVAKPFFHKPILVWGFGSFMHEGERVNLGSTAGTGVVKGTLREMGVQHEMIYQLPGNPDTDPKIKSRIRAFANVARAIALLEQARILTIGYLFGGMSLGDMDLTKLRTRFGPELVEVSNYTLIHRMEELDRDSPQYKEGVAFVNEHLTAPIGGKIDRIARMYVILRQLVDENRAQALTLKCHFVLSQEYGLTACVPLSVIGNTVVSACEADIPVLLTQMVMNYLSGGSTSTYADVHEIVDNRVLVAACGYAPSSMCIGGKIIADLPAENATGLGATFKDYITNKNYLMPGRVTFGRFLKESDGGFALHFTTGDAAGDIGRVSELGAPQYPFTEIELHAEIDRFAQNMGSHHYAIVYSDISAELELFCRLKDIRIIHD
jgi:L-fucose isomerase-like protein